MKCDNCKYNCTYTTRYGEYPPVTTIRFCEKGNWADDGEDISMRAKDMKEY